MSAPIDDEDFGIDLNEYAANQEKQDQSDLQNSSIDMGEYNGSPEQESATWWDVAQDTFVQPALGALQAYTWPTSLIKYGMTKIALGDLDEAQETARKQGIEFNKDEYLKKVSPMLDFVPTQELLEEQFSKKTGIGLEPKSDWGKRLKQFFRIREILKGKGAAKAAKGGLGAVGTTEALNRAGASEDVSELVGDIGGGALGSLQKSPRILSKEGQVAADIAKKHNLPFPEFMSQESNAPLKGKITDSRKAAFQENLGKSSEQALEEILDNRLSVSKLKKKGVDLEVLYDTAYEDAKTLARTDSKAVPLDTTIKDIESEINRIKEAAPSPSSGDLKSIEILEREKEILSKAKPTSEKLITQIQKYNENVKGIYKKPEFSGNENAVRNTFAFLNNSIRNTLENYAPPGTRKLLGVAENLYKETSQLNRAQGLIEKAFVNGQYNPKKLNQLLNSKQGNIIRRELGHVAVSEMKDIAKYGEQAINATNQLAKSPLFASEIKSWGPLAGFLIAKLPTTATIIGAAKPLANYIRGYLITNPAARTVYKDIVKNAADGSFKGMKNDFDKLDEIISKQYGSVDDFIQTAMGELELYDEE